MANISEAAILPSIGESGLIKNWVLAAILYTSYNTIISIAILGPLGAKARDMKAIRNGAILGGLGLGVGSVMIFLALSGNISSVSKLEVPMIYIAGNIAPIVQIIYAVVLIAEVYTTAVGSLNGFIWRIVNLKESPKKGKVLVIGTTIAAFFASQFGFSNLVKYLYPLVGYGGIVMLISLIYTKYIVKKSGIAST